MGDTTSPCVWVVGRPIGAADTLPGRMQHPGDHREGEGHQGRRQRATWPNPPIRAAPDWLYSRADSHRWRPDSPSDDCQLPGTHTPGEVTLISQTYPLSHPGSASSRAQAAPPRRHHVHVPTRRGPASHRDESAAQRSPSGPPAQGSRAGRPSAASSEVERHGHELGPPGQGLRAAPRWSTGGAGLSAHKHGSGQVLGVRCRTRGSGAGFRTAAHARRGAGLGAQAWGSGAGFRTAARCSACGAGLGAQDSGLRRGVPNQRRGAPRAVLGSRLEFGLRSRAPAGTQPGWRLRFRCEVLGSGAGWRQGQVDRRCRATASGNCAIVLVRITACWGSTMRRLADRWSHTAPRDTGAGTGAEFARSSVRPLFHVKPQVRISTCDGSSARGRRRSAPTGSAVGVSTGQEVTVGRRIREGRHLAAHTRKQLGRQRWPLVGGGPVTSRETQSLRGSCGLLLPLGDRRCST